MATTINTARLVKLEKVQTYRHSPATTFDRATGLVSAPVNSRGWYEHQMKWVSCPAGQATHVLDTNYEPHNLSAGGQKWAISWERGHGKLRASEVSEYVRGGGRGVPAEIKKLIAE